MKAPTLVLIAVDEHDGHGHCALTFKSPSSGRIMTVIAEGGTEHHRAYHGQDFEIVPVTAKPVPAPQPGQSSAERQISIDVAYARYLVYERYRKDLNRANREYGKSDRPLTQSEFFNKVLYQGA